MTYHCKNCGERINGSEANCPNCLTPVIPVSNDNSRQTSRFYLDKDDDFDLKKTAKRPDGGIPCPRCGEILMPGANVCEFCGEVIRPIGRIESYSRVSGVAGSLPVEEEEGELPKVIRCKNLMATPDRVVVDAVETRKRNSEQGTKSGSFTAGILVVICVLVALIAGVVTWSIIHFMRASNQESTEKTEFVTEEFDYSKIANDIGSEPKEAAPAIVAPVARAEEPVLGNVVDGDDVPIEGMRESLAGSWTFYGKVNNKFSIGIDLKIEPDGSISGCYWYDSTLRQNGDEPSSYFNLEGEVDDTGKAILSAFKYGENSPVEKWTGRFSGVTPLKFSGSFRSTNGTTYSFSSQTRKN